MEAASREGDRRRLLVDPQQHHVFLEVLEVALHREDLSLCGEERRSRHRHGVLASWDDQVESAVGAAEGAAELGPAMNRDAHSGKDGA